MKKSILITIITFAFLSTSTAQVNSNAIGIRGGGGFGGSYGGEISYQKGFGESNRLELDFGFYSSRRKNHKDFYYDYYNHLSVSGIYHWVFNLTGGLNWFIGPGAQVGFYDYNHNYDDGDFYKDRSGISLAIGGQLGLEYDFNEHGIPLLLSLDARPMWDMIGYYNGFGGGAAFALRYTF